MKKITLLIVALLFTIVGYSQFPTPGSEGFEGTTGTDLPTTPTPWTLGTGATGNQWAVFDNGVGPTRKWGINTAVYPAYQGTNCAFIDRENIGLGNTSEDYLATPIVTVPANGQLRFWTRSTIATVSATEYLIKVNTNVTAGSQTTAANYTITAASWTETTLNTTYNVYEEKVVDLSAFPAGTQVHIAFVMRHTQPTAGLGGDRWLVDDIRLVQRCLEPTNLSATGITQTSANLNWTNPSGSTSWEIEVIPSVGGTQTGVGVVYNGALPYPATGLAPGTAYVYYVRSLCTDGSSNWVGPFNFATTTPGLSCVAPITVTTLPYSTNDNTANYGDTTDTNQGTSCGSATNFMTGNDVFYSYTPTTTGAISITMTPGSNSSSIFVYQGCANVGATCLAGVANTTNTVRSIPSLNVTAGQQYIIVLSGTTAAQTYAYSLVIQQLNCAQPTNLAVTGISLNGGNLSWDNPGGATSWEYEVQLANGLLPTGAGTQTSSNTTNPVTGLNPDTAYQYWVRADCGNGTFSAWSGPFLFNTLVPPPACGGTFTDPGGATTNYANNLDSTVVICPSTPGEVVTVTFTAFNTQASNDGLYIFNGNSVASPQFLSGNPAGTVPGGLAGSYWGTTNPGAFTSSSADGCLTFRFRSNATTNAAGWVANVTCALPPACPAPFSVTANTVLNSSANIAWTAAGPATEWHVLALPCGSPVPTATSTGWVTANTNPFTLTGLTGETCYNVYVRSACSVSDLSTWSGPAVFTTTITPPACGGTFTDPGGALANYANNTDSTVTICPTIPGEQVTVTFTAFNTEATWDGLYIFDGNSITSPQIATANPAGNVPGGLPGSFWGNLTANLPGPFTASSASGCLTFRFRSDGSVNNPGWVANVTCAPPPTCPKPSAVTASAVTFNQATIAWTNNSTATEWQVLALPCGSPAPTATSTGWVAAPTNPFTLTGLTPNTCYNFYVRAVCSLTDISLWSLSATATTQVAPPVCGGNFVDPGGPTANYANNTDSTVTICPTVPGEVVTVTFTAFNTQASNDGLYIFNGNSIAAPQISSGNPAGTVPGGLAGAFWGTVNPGTFTSSSPDGCLTFRFRSGAATVAAGWSSNITCGLPPTCPNPITVVPSGLTDSSVTLAWTETGTATAWQVLALPCGSPAPTSTSTGWVAAGTNPFTLTGLTGSTCYNIYVRSACSASDFSTWSYPISITTNVTPPACGGVFTDVAGPNANYANNSDSTVTICPTIPGEQVTVTFTFFDTEATWDGLYVFDGNSIAAPQIATANPAGNVPGGLPGSFWGNLTGVNLPGPFTGSSASGCLTFRFRSDGSVNRAGWIANITCAPIPTCPKPTAVVVSSVTQTGATISWTEIGTATTWEVLILPAGSPAPTATSVGIITTTNPYIATGLSPGTPYIVYVRSICSASDISLWSNVRAFTTLIANDECINATVAPVNPTNACTQSVGGTLIGATASAEANACVGTDDDDVWFQFTATSTAHTINLNNITGSTTDLVHVLYSGSCGTLTQISCNNPNNSLANNLVVGQTYYVRVYSWTATANQTSTFSLCIGTPVPPPSCITNTPAGNTCAVATPICNLNGYCGNTSASYTSDSWPELSAEFCGSLENNSFLTFVASSSTISLDVWVTSSEDNLGIQIMIFGAATCGSGPVTEYLCWSPGNVPTTSTNLTATGLVPGQTYYVMIDGFAGDVCNYVIGANTGIQTPVAINTSTSTTSPTICLGQTATLNATGGNGIYTWTPSTQLSATTGSSVIFSPTAVGTYNITATSSDNNPLCPQSASSTQTIIVVDYVNATFNQIAPFCEGTTPPVLPTTSTTGVTGTWSPPVVSNVVGTTTYTFTPAITQCSFPTTMDIVVTPSIVPTFLAPAPICPGSPAPVLPTSSSNSTPITGSWSPPTVSNTASGTYTFTPDAGQCATTTTLNVTVLPSCDFGSYASAVWLTNCATSNFFNTVGTGVDIIGPATNVFPNTDLGTYVQNSNALILRGAEVKTFKSATANVCSARLNYRIYPAATTPGAFTVMDLPFFDNCGGGTFPSGGPCNTGDQKWQRVLNDSQSPINLTAYAPGDYVLEVYYDVTGDVNSTTDCDDTVIINNNGANYIATYTIQAQPAYTSTNPTTCGGTDGTITISGLAPNEIYNLTYQDDTTSVGPNSITTNATGEFVITGLNSGNYSNFLLSINSCLLTNSTPIILVDANSPTVTVNSPTVCAGTPATVTATPGATGIYNYVWTVPTGATDPGNVATFDAAISGTYSVIITNTATSCSSSSVSSVVTINANPTVTVNSPTVCAGTPATVTATPGTAGTYNYVWTVPTGATDPGNVATFDATVSGTYSVVITDTATSCTSSNASGIVTINTNPTVTVNSPTVCAGTPATVIATPSAAGTYNYVWTAPTGATDPGNVATFDAAISGTYSVVITDITSGCSSSIVSSVVTINANPTVTVNSPTVCAGTPATVTATSGTSGTYNYVWTVPTGATDPGNVATFDATISGTYSVVITDTTSGCSSTSVSSVVTINANPTVTVNSPTVCAGTPATVTATPGTLGTYNYVWTVPTGATDPGNVVFGQFQQEQQTQETLQHLMRLFQELTQLLLQIQLQVVLVLVHQEL